MNSYKYYAVKHGRTKGIYFTEEDAQKQIVNFPNGEYEVFTDIKKAERYALNIKNSVQTTLTGLQLLLAPQQSVSNSNSNSNKTVSTGNTLNSNSNKTVSTGNTLNIKLQKTSESKLKPDSERVVVYTDGSCFNNGQKGAVAGIGAYFPDSQKYNISAPLAGKQTNQCAELTAILQTLKLFANTPELSNKKLLIKTDSEYSINVITKWIPSWRSHNWEKRNGHQISNVHLIANLDQEIQNMRKRVGNGSVKLEHVKAHSNDFGNDMADKLAKQGGGILT
jgi:ribonuclease HI